MEKNYSDMLVPAREYWKQPCPEGQTRVGGFCINSDNVRQITENQNCNIDEYKLGFPWERPKLNFCVDKIELNRVVRDTEFDDTHLYTLIDNLYNIEIIEAKHDPITYFQSKISPVLLEKIKYTDFDITDEDIRISVDNVKRIHPEIFAYDYIDFEMALAYDSNIGEDVTNKLFEWFNKQKKVL